jgi:hypothetical protein
LEGSGHSSFEVLFQYFLIGVEEHHANATNRIVGARPRFEPSTPLPGTILERFRYARPLSFATIMKGIRIDSDIDGQIDEWIYQ